MGISTVSTITQEVMSAMWTVLSASHMAVPSEENFIRIADRFYEKWGFPNCIGSIDGRHIRIKKPANSGSLYFNYKKYFSMVLQAVVDADYRFIFIDVGGYGSQHDAGTFQASNVYKALIHGRVSLPSDRKVHGSEIILPHVFVGDGAYPLMESIMKPYAGKKLSRKQIKFNKSLSRARVVVENTFGQVCQKWRIFYTTIDKSVDTIKLIGKSTCVLHNMIIDLERVNRRATPGTARTTHENLLPVTYGEREFISGLGKEVRDEYAKYFMR